MNRGLPRRCLSLLLALSLAGSLFCPALAEESGPSAPVPVTGVTLDKSSLSLVPGETAVLTAAVEPDSATDQSVTWSTSNPGVATVDSEDGLTAIVSAVDYGSTEITVTTGDGGMTASCTVVIMRPSATGLTLDHTALTLDPGDTAGLTAVLTPFDADPTNVTWESSDTRVATVSPTGGAGETTVTAAGPGEATLTAASGGLSADCAVEVSGVILDKSSLSLVEGASENLTARSYGRAKTSSYAWAVSDPNVARVSGGQVTALSQGTARVTVTGANGYTKDCTLTVSPNTAGVITADADAGHPLSFSSLERQLQSRCRDVLGASLDHILSLIHI